MADIVIPHYGEEFKSEDPSLSFSDMKYRHGIDVRDHQDHFQNFNRAYAVYPWMEMGNITQWVFITRPDLNIVDWSMDAPRGKLTEFCSRDAMFQYMHTDHRIILKSLSSALSPTHDFIPMLVHRTESLQLADITLRTSSMVQPATGYEITYAGNAIESTTSCDFEITFRDDENYRLMKLFHTWVYYINGIYLNLWQPKRNYVKNKIYDYMVSIYKIDCGPDGETIVYYEKYTGAFPTAVPISTLSFNRGGTPENKISIPFKAQIQEALNPYILSDFNKNSRSNGTAVDWYDPDVNGTGDPIVGAPFIIRENNVFKLKWSPRSKAFL